MRGPGEALTGGVTVVRDFWEHRHLATDSGRRCHTDPPPRVNSPPARSQRVISIGPRERHALLISVVVPTIRATTLPFTVAAVRAQTWEDWELLIVAQGDDATLAEVCKAAEKEDPRIHYIHLAQRGLSLAKNAGIQAALGDVVAFTDDDCEPDPEWLERINQSFAEQPSVGIVAGDTFPGPRSRFRWLSTCPATRTIECLYKPTENNFRAPPGFYYGGANLAVRRDVFRLVGSFDEYLGPGTDFPAAEDVDFALRAEERGINMWTRPSIVVRHTYGRRYGLRNFLSHHRGYALGSGALGGKLKLLDHRLSREWGKRRRRRDVVISSLKNPPRALLERYKGRHIAQATIRYLAEFELDEKACSRPKASPTVNAPS